MHGDAVMKGGKGWIRGKWRGREAKNCRWERTPQANVVSSSVVGTLRASGNIGQAIPLERQGFFVVSSAVSGMGEGAESAGVGAGPGT